MSDLRQGFDDDSTTNLNFVNMPKIHIDNKNDNAKSLNNFKFNVNNSSALANGEENKNPVGSVELKSDNLFNFSFKKDELQASFAPSRLGPSNSSKADNLQFDKKQEKSKETNHSFEDFGNQPKGNAENQESDFSSKNETQPLIFNIQGNDNKQAINFKLDNSDKQLNELGTKPAVSPFIFDQKSQETDTGVISPKLAFHQKVAHVANDDYKLKEKASQNTEEKIKDDLLMSEYNPPLLTDEMEIINDDDFSEFDIDERTQLPIRKLPYSDGPISKNDLKWLRNGRHLDFTVSNVQDKGVLYLASNDIQKHGSKAADVTLFPFDLVPQSDHSTAYTKFLNQLYKEFEHLLVDQQYKFYSDDDEDDMMNIGVVNIIRERLQEKKTFLRKLITFTLENMKKMITQKMKDEISLNDTWVMNYEEILNVLNLMNALYFSQADERIILLQKWVERADLQPDDAIFQAAFEGSNKPYQNFSFWSVYLKKMVMRGSFANIIDDLNVCKYEELKENDFSLFQLIEDFKDLLSNYDSVKFSYDLKEFLKWKNSAVELRTQAGYLDVKNKDVYSEILELLKILCGLPKTIEDNSSTWYECYLALFLFQMPSMNFVPEYLERSLNLDIESTPIEGLNTWDSICVDLFRGKFLTVISSLEALDKSIATFTAILMEASGLLKNYIDICPPDGLINSKKKSSGIGENIDSMLEDLALTYLNDDEFFTIGVGILISVNNSKTREILSEALPTYKIKNNDDFEWILSICSKLKLPQTAMHIFRIQGEILFQKGYQYESLYCFAESGASDRVVAIVWKIFETLLVEGKLEDTFLIDKIKANDIDSPILRQALAPLNSLYEIFNDCQSKAWFERIKNLLNFNYLQSHYKCILLLIIYPFLNKNAFSVDELIEIIKVLNAYDNELKLDDGKCEKSMNMYELVLSTKDKKVGNFKFDWRQEMELPSNPLALITDMRKNISMEISFRFLEES